MTNEQQIKALAELRGIVCKPTDCWGVALFNAKGESIGTAWSEEKYAWAEYCEFCKDLTSYDAIIPLIQKQPTSIVIAIQIYACKVSDTSLQATPAQLCEALLRATGRWEEKK